MIQMQLLNQRLDELHLLKHEFYQAWNMGELSLETLKIYAREYYHHVAAFPRYLSRIHSNCADLKTRQILLGNLIEEEQGEENHPELWKNFAQGLGVSATDIAAKAQLPRTNRLVDGYFELVENDFAKGLGALYAYERQTPEVAKSKIDGLTKHYNITDEETLKFFNVHMQADEWHSQECADIIASLSPEDQAKAAQGAELGAKLLWGFLDEMMGIHSQNTANSFAIGY